MPTKAKHHIELTKLEGSCGPCKHAHHCGITAEECVRHSNEDCDPWLNMKPSDKAIGLGMVALFSVAFTLIALECI